MIGNDMGETSPSGLDVLFTPDVLAALRNQAERKGITISEFITEAVLDALEDAEDSKRADEAYAEYLVNPVSHSMDEVFGDLRR